MQYNVGTVTYISDGGVNVGTVTYISDGGPSSNTSAIVGSTVAVFVVLAVVSALLIVALVIFFKKRSAAKNTLLVNKYEHHEMTERKEGSLTLFFNHFFLFTGFPDVENEGNDQKMHHYNEIHLCIIAAMNVGRK